MRTLFSTIVSLVRLILLVAQAEGVGGEGAATEPALGYRGGTADRKQVKKCAAIVYIGWMRV